MLPNIVDCEFFKKGAIYSGQNTEQAFIFKLKGAKDYTFVFNCPACKKSNEFYGDFVLKKAKEGGKQKEYVTFSCKNCNAEFMMERLKARARA